MIAVLSRPQLEDGLTVNYWERSSYCHGQQVRSNSSGLGESLVPQRRASTGDVQAQLDRHSPALKGEKVIEQTSPAQTFLMKCETNETF